MVSLVAGTVGQSGTRGENTALNLVLTWDRQNHGIPRLRFLVLARALDLQKERLS
jgi:hypothetical protein